MKTITLFLLLILYQTAAAQAPNTCLAELFALEDQLMQRREVAATQTILLQYDMQTLDWDNAVSKSSVRLYKRGINVHLFSTQADLFQDKSNMFLVLHEQRTILWNNTGNGTPGLSEDFLNFRKSFLEACTLERCETSNNEKHLVLVPAKNKPEGVFVEKMEYVFASNHQELQSIAIQYSNKYKLKKLAVQFQALFQVANHAFGKTARDSVLDSSGRPKGKYAGYILLDERS